MRTSFAFYSRVAALSVLLLNSIAQNCQAAGWTTEFVPTGPPSVFVYDSDQVAVDAMGRATSAQWYSPAPDDFNLGYLLFVRTGTATPYYLRQDPNTVSTGKVSLTASGTRTFATANLTKTGDAASSCWLLELGDSGILSETLLTTGTQMACSTVIASTNRIFIVTVNRQVLIANLSGQVQSTVHLGASTSEVAGANIGSNGDLLLTEGVWSVGIGTRLISSRVSENGALRWQNDSGLLNGELYFTQAETSNSEFMLAYALGTEVSMTRFDLNGVVTASTSVDTGGLLDDLCIIGSDAYLVDHPPLMTRIRKLQFPAQITPIANIATGSDTPSAYLICNPQRIFTSLNFSSGGHDLLQLRPDGQFVTRTRLWSSHRFGLFAQNNDFVALQTAEPSAIGAASPNLYVYHSDGRPYDHAAVHDLPLQPEAIDLVGSDTHGALLATEAFGAVAVHDVQPAGRRWSKQVRKDYFGADEAYSYILPFEMARRADGGADVLSGDLRYHLIRFTPTGTESARYPLAYYGVRPFVHELRYLDDGSVAAVAEAMPYLFRNGTQTSGHALTLSLTGEDINSLRFVGYNPYECPSLSCPPPIAYYAGFTPQLELDSGPKVVLTDMRGGLRLHRNGLIDHVAGLSVAGSVEASRFANNGDRIFGPTIPVSGSSGKTLDAAVHPDFGHLIALESAASPNSASILLRLNATGNVIWMINLPFRATSIALDDFGRVGASGKSVTGSHLRIFEADGSPWLTEDCGDRRTCAFAPTLVAAAGDRWFAAGSSAANPESLVRNTYVREYDTSLFSSSFE